METLLNAQKLSRSILRDWSLITGRGATKREGGACEVLSLQKGGGGGRKGFSNAEGGGGTTSFEVVFTR